MNSSRSSGRGGGGDVSQLQKQFDEFKEASETQVKELLTRIKELELGTKRREAFGDFQFKDVVFNATAGADTEISHDLPAANPESVRAFPVMWEFITTPVEPPYIYRSGVGSRRPWGPGYIILRCNIASAVVRMLLITES